jgi:hypothetical protein
LLVGLLASGCSSGRVSVGDDRRIDAGLAAGAGAGGDSNSDSGAAGIDAGLAGMNAAAGSPPTAAGLLALLDPCTAISNGPLAPAAGRTKDITVCGFGSAVYWKSELAVDCDGKRTDTCNSQTDPQYQGTTIGKDSAGNSLDAAAVPYVEVPKASTTFDYRAAGLSMGTVVAVIYKNQLSYGVVGQEQDPDTIGNASYAMAVQLGINSDPVRGGLQSEDVTYIAFKGAANVIPALEDVNGAAALAEKAASDLIAAGR